MNRQEKKTVLNVGGSTKDIEIPSIYAGWQHLLLDLVEKEDVDFVMDARDMDMESQFDGIYLSHTLEHFPSKDIQLVLGNFRRALKPKGHVYIVVPNFGMVVQAMAEHDMDIQQPIYESSAGPVTGQDMIFGSPRGWDRDSEDFMIHKTGFTLASLRRELEGVGFDNISVEAINYDIVAIGWVEEADSILRRVMVSPSITEASVAIGYAHNGSIRHEFYQSLKAAQFYDFHNGKHIIAESSAGGPYIPQNRNYVCEQVLTTNAEWLWMLDTDVVFPPDLLDRMLEIADPINRPILAAVYFTTIGERWMPVWLEKNEDGLDVPVQSITIGEVRELATVGMGCTLIHRSVLEQMQKDYSHDAWPWFNHDLIDGERCGEDVTFCHRARQSGFKTHGLAYPITHMKTYTIDWKTFHDQYRLLELDATATRTLL